VTAPESETAPARLPDTEVSAAHASVSQKAWAHCAAVGSAGGSKDSPSSSSTWSKSSGASGSSSPCEAGQEGEGRAVDICEECVQARLNEPVGPRVATEGARPRRVARAVPRSLPWSCPRPPSTWREADRATAGRLLRHRVFRVPTPASRWSDRRKDRPPQDVQSIHGVVQIRRSALSGSSRACGTASQVIVVRRLSV